MNSPFPGMDPFLELRWGDVHTSLMVYIRNQINTQLPSDLQARVEEGGKVSIEDDVGIDDEPRNRRVVPDVRIVENSEGGGTAVMAESSVIEADLPTIIELPEEPVARHIEIVDTRDEYRVVTAIEVLSPANKVGTDGPRVYRAKQHIYLQSGVNLVEIDLLRQGGFVLAVAEEAVPDELLGDYLVCVRRTGSGKAELYRGSMVEPLPVVAIPLRRKDRDVPLELQPLIDACYRDGRYADTDYSQALNPRLSDIEIDWLKARLEQRAKA